MVTEVWPGHETDREWMEHHGAVIRARQEEIGLPTDAELWARTWHTAGWQPEPQEADRA